MMMSMSGTTDAGLPLFLTPQQQQEVQIDHPLPDIDFNNDGKNQDNEIPEDLNWVLQQENGCKNRNGDDDNNEVKVSFDDQAEKIMFDYPEGDFGFQNEVVWPEPAASEPDKKPGKRRRRRRPTLNRSTVTESTREKYDRERYLNNLASIRCRKKRSEQKKALEGECEALEDKNERLVAKLKRKKNLLERCYLKLNGHVPPERRLQIEALIKNTTC